MEPPYRHPGFLTDRERKRDRLVLGAQGVDQQPVAAEGRRGRDAAHALEGRQVQQIVATYAEIPAGAIGALFGSTDHLELAANGGSAADQLGISRGARVEVLRIPHP